MTFGFMLQLLQLIVSCMFYCKQIRRVRKGNLESHIAEVALLESIKADLLISFETHLFDCIRVGRPRRISRALNVHICGSKVLLESAPEVI